MDSLPELVGTVHIILGPYRGNPIALYMCQDESTCRISPRIYPWNQTVGTGETPNKAAADFEARWKETDLADDMYTGPHWEGGIKPEKPKPDACSKTCYPSCCQDRGRTRDQTPCTQITGPVGSTTTSSRSRRRGSVTTPSPLIRIESSLSYGFCANQAKMSGTGYVRLAANCLADCINAVNRRF